MAEQRTGKNPPTGGTSNPQHESQRAIANDVGNPLPDNAVGDRGPKGKNWQPPAGEQGLSNRPDDEADGSAGEAFVDDTDEVDTENLDDDPTTSKKN